MRYRYIYRKALITMIGVAASLVFAVTAMAQNSPRDEYEEWQSARRELLNEQREYNRNPTRSNWRGLQDAIRDEQRERAEYQMALARFGGRWNPRMNDRIYNDGRTVVNVNRRGMFRIRTNGQFYTVDDRGYNLLRQAVNRGYQQGYHAGLNDRRFGRGMSYYNNSMYRSGTFGYEAVVARNQYQYYFQQGFQRGYEDGFNSQTRFGYRTGNTFNILGSVLNTILNIAEAVDDDNDYR